MLIEVGVVEGASTVCVDVPHLRYVAAAAEHRSFRRAATALNVTQPTLSKRIRELEDRLGVLLFERSPGGACLTPVGEEFVQSARRVLEELELMERRARDGRRGDAGRLEIGFYTSLAGSLRDVVFAFAEQHSRVDVNATEESRSALIPLLDRGAIDVVVVLGEPSYPDYAHMSLWSERVMVVLHQSHSLAAREFVYWTDLKTERFVMSQRDPGPEIQDILLNKLGSPGDRPYIKPVKAHHSLMLSAVDGKRGITLACESSCSAAPPGLVFREVRDGNGPTRVGFVAYWRRNNDNPTLKCFLGSLRAHPAVPAASDASS